ncbi:MAG: class III extradiol ring-cleavage dioxygenase [Pseudobdellovibrionaceae bacterium]|jgi:aromatic ring-opening dioxygenase catalytic subunit (LigB family)|nr:class III extradiol ring-cleavage dioxygenase [Pseudobdellovibrionaceae bacterium]
MNKQTETLQPTFFIPHGGGPCFFMEWEPHDEWDKTAAFLKSIPSQLPRKPSAILLVSSHWEENEFTILGKDHPGLLFDYHGFPEHTYQLDYPVENPKWLVSRILELAQNTGQSIKKDTNRDYDHGVFIPLKVAFPEADIPVAQLSLKANLNPADHFKIGKMLTPLRAENVLIIGSGMSYHNMRVLMSRGRSENLSGEFNEWLVRSITDLPHSERQTALTDWEKAPGARNAHPREEHLISLMVAAGAAGDSVGQHVFEDIVMGSTISAFRFG